MTQTAEQGKFRIEGSAVYFSVTSDGTTGKQWVRRLKEKGYHINIYAEDALLSPDFKPTSGVTTEIVVLKGSFFKKDSDRTTKNIHVYADEKGWTKPNAEVACLIREMFTDKEIEAMGLVWIVTMHEPIKNRDDVSRLLRANRSDGGRWFGTVWDAPGRQWDRIRGFAFVASQPH